MNINETIGKAVAKKKGMVWAESFLAHDLNGGDPLDRVWSQELHDFHTLDDITEAVRILCGGDNNCEQLDFENNLIKELHPESTGSETEFNDIDFFAVLNATAKQKAKALLPIAKEILKDE